MTKTAALLGPHIDGRPTTPTEYAMWAASETSYVVGWLRQAEDEGRADDARELRWELAALKLNLPTTKLDARTRGQPLPDYLAGHQVTDATPDYLRERLAETANPYLRVRYAELLLLLVPATGRVWWETTRLTAFAYRDVVEHMCALVAPNENGTTALHMNDALRRAAQLITPPGVLNPVEQENWGQWIVGLAQFVHDHPWAKENDPPRHHRWPFEILEHLSAIPASAVAEPERRVALGLLEAAYAAYLIEPLAEHFAMRVAEVEAALRKHFGERDVTCTMARKQYEALMGRVRLHADTGHGLLTGHFYHEARRLVEQYRSCFDRAIVDALQAGEQDAWQAAVAGGEFKRVTGGSISVSHEDMDHSKDTPAETAAALTQLCLDGILQHDEVATAIGDAMAKTPLLSMMPTVVVGDGKVVAEAMTDEQRLAQQVRARTAIYAELIGASVALTVRRAKERCGFTADDLLLALRAELPDSQRFMLHLGFEHLLAEDYISAIHILVPQTEDLLRRRLNALGVETTEFQVLGGDLDNTRTDDATLGRLLYRRGPDGRSVREILGPDLWNLLDATLVAPAGMNLRNQVAHGLMPVGAFTAPVAGIVVQLLVALSHRLGGSLRDDISVAP